MEFYNVKNIQHLNEIISTLTLLYFKNFIKFIKYLTSNLLFKGWNLDKLCLGRKQKEKLRILCKKAR